MIQTDYRQAFEVVVKVLVGAVVFIAAVWLIGFVLHTLGALMLSVSGFLIELLKFLVPVAALGVIVYWIIDRLRPARDG